MGRRVNEPVQVELRHGSVPVALTWRGRRYRILEVLAWWREPGAWWQGEGVRLFLRVRALGKGERIMELSCEEGQWVLQVVLV